MREIGSQLGVCTVLEGSVRKAGNRVRITAQLINAMDGYHLWSEVYDRKLEDIFEVQDEISSRIAIKLREKLTYRDNDQRLVKAYTNNVEAYKIFLQGLFEWNKWNPHAVKEAIKLFEKAVKLAPEFVLPYVMISSAYVYLGAIGYIKSSRAYPIGKKYALKAIEMDDTISDSHISLGVVRLFYDWDFEGAEESFQTALSISPSNAGAHNTYTYLLTAQMRLDEAFEHIKIALDLDPLSIRINHAYGDLLLMSGKFEEAIEQFDKSLEIDPDFRGSLYSKGWAYCKMNQLDKAIELFEEAHKRTGSDLKGITQLGYVYGKVGRIDEARDLLDKMQIRQDQNPEMDLDVDFAIIHFGLGNLEKTFEFLDKAYKSRNGSMLFLRSPLWSEIHSHPKFKELIAKIGV
jgi:tetratricopeptide (TPR) repeat protein